MASYSDYQSKLAPPWLQGANGTIIQQGLGAEKDVFLDRTRQGVLANFPDQGPADALPHIGADWVLPQAAGESNANYRERLRTAWDSVSGWSFAGSHGSLLRALDRAGFPMGTPDGCHIIQRTQRYTYLTATGGDPVFGVHAGWQFDGSPPGLWNQFGLLFGADVSGLTDGSALADRLNTTVRLWKPGKARFMGTKVIVSGPTWGWPIGVRWGDMGLTWGGGVTRSIAP